MFESLHKQSSGKVYARGALVGLDVKQRVYSKITRQITRPNVGHKVQSMSTQQVAQANPSKKFA